MSKPVWNDTGGPPPKDLIPTGMPDPGGSLGTCAVCGDSFVVETLMNEAPQSFSVPLLKNLLFAHNKCADVIRSITDGDWKKLPEGPLRKAYSEAAERKPNDPKD